MHWGTEYSMDVTATQKNLSKMMADEGVSLVIGHHPHVLAWAVERTKQAWQTRGDGGRKIRV